MANEKRLIDANALKHFVCELCNAVNSDEPCEPSDCRCMEVINEMPTVEAVEVVHGRWEKQDWKGVSIKGFMACSNCNVMIPTADNNRYCLLKLNYCPNCGAKMGGDGNA